jgi:heat shock protein HspQ
MQRKASLGKKSRHGWRMSAWQCRTDAKAATSAQQSHEVTIWLQIVFDVAPQFSPCGKGSKK